MTRSATMSVEQVARVAGGFDLVTGPAGGPRGRKACGRAGGQIGTDRRAILVKDRAPCDRTEPGLRACAGPITTGDLRPFVRRACPMRAIAPAQGDPLAGRYPGKHAPVPAEALR